MLIHDRCLGTIAFPAGSPAVLTKFCSAWGKMVAYNAEYLCGPGEYVHYDDAAVPSLAHVRNSLVKRMRGDWLLQLDTDHEFEPDLACRLVHRLHAYGLDVVTGVYVMKNFPHPPILYRQEGNGNFTHLIGWEGEGNLKPCDSAGAGCLLVRRRVFDRIARELDELPFEYERVPGRKESYYEDHSFFRRLARLSPPVKVYFDRRVESPHLQVRPLTLADRGPMREGERLATEGLV